MRTSDACFHEIGVAQEAVSDLFRGEMVGLIMIHAMSVYDHVPGHLLGFPPSRLCHHLALLLGKTQQVSRRAATTTTMSEMKES